MQSVTTRHSGVPLSQIWAHE